MSAHHSIALDDEDAFRMARTFNEVLGLRMRALARIDRHLLLPQHRDFVHWVCRMPIEQRSDRQRQQVTRLAWVYRRNLPNHLAPKVNPDDPIVREMSAKGEIHA